MSESNSERGPRWTIEAAVLALVGLGLMVAAIFGSAAPAVSVAEIVVGAGLVLIAAVLPRIEGIVKIGATGIEIPLKKVIQYFEATRQLAEHEAPDQVDKAVGLAYEEVLQRFSRDALLRLAFGDVDEKRFRKDALLRVALERTLESPEEFARRIVRQRLQGEVRPSGTVAAERTQTQPNETDR